MYALPAHTPDKTQPRDVVLFLSFKSKLNESLLLAASTDKCDRFDAFCSMMRLAFYAAFTRDNIQASFKRAGIWALDALWLLGVPPSALGCAGVADHRRQRPTEPVRVEAARCPSVHPRLRL